MFSSEACPDPGPQSPQVSPRGFCASLNRRLFGLSIGDVTEFPVVPPERGLVKATLCWQHTGQVQTLARKEGPGSSRIEGCKMST